MTASAWLTGEPRLVEPHGSGKTAAA